MRGKYQLSVCLILSAFLLNSGVFPIEDLTPVQKAKDGIQTGTVSGRVFEPDLSASSGATVLLKLGENNKIEGKTDSKGFYMFSGVPAGTGYSITAKKGDMAVTINKVNVAAGRNTKVDLVLAIKEKGKDRGKSKNKDSSYSDDGFMEPEPEPAPDQGRDQQNDLEQDRNKGKGKGKNKQSKNDF